MRQQNESTDWAGWIQSLTPLVAIIVICVWGAMTAVDVVGIQIVRGGWQQVHATYGIRGSTVSTMPEKPAKEKKQGVDVATQSN